MNYEVGDILTLSNNAKYVVVTTVPYQGKNYVYLVNQDNNVDIMFCEYNDKTFEKVDDFETIKKLLELIKPDMQEILYRFGTDKQ